MDAASFLRGQAHCFLTSGEHQAFSLDGTHRTNVIPPNDNMDGVMAERDFDISKIFAKSNLLSGTTLLVRVWNSTDNGATWNEIALVKIPDGNREAADSASAFIQATSLYCFSVETVGGPYFGPVSYLCT